MKRKAELKMKKSRIKNEEKVWIKKKKISEENLELKRVYLKPIKINIINSMKIQKIKKSSVKKINIAKKLYVIKNIKEYGENICMLIPKRKSKDWKSFIIYYTINTFKFR